MDVNRIVQGNYIPTPVQVEGSQNDNLITEPESIDVVNKQYNKNNNQEYNKKDLDKAVKKLNKFLEDENAHAEYSIHKDLKTLMIKIIDDKTKEVILETPPKKILDMIASICKQFGLIDKKA